MNIYLIRHAQSTANANPAEYFHKNDWDIELTEEGKKQSKILKNKITEEFRWGGWNLAISSSFKRAIQTRDISTENLSRISLDTSPLLIERQWGGLREIVDNRELDREQHFNFYYRPPNGGESFFDCYQRVVMFFQELRTNPKYQRYDNIFIFTHGEWIRLALMYLDGKSVEEFTENQKNQKNCEMIKRVL
jgi:broad specificity phosphatase PhoE